MGIFEKRMCKIEKIGFYIKIEKFLYELMQMLMYLSNFRLVYD